MPFRRSTVVRSARRRTVRRFSQANLNPPAAAHSSAATLRRERRSMSSRTLDASGIEYDVLLAVANAACAGRDHQTRLGRATGARCLEEPAPRQTGQSTHPKASAPCTLNISPAKGRLLRVPKRVRWGAIIPRPAGGGHHPARQAGGEGRAPVVAVLALVLNRQTSPLLPPKGTDPGPCSFLPANRLFSGDRRKGP
jgi:hypothetical protein